MKCCQDCVNKYTYNNMEVGVQPCDACNNFSNFKEVPIRHFSMWDEDGKWQYMRMTARIISPHSYRFTLEVIGYHENDTYIQGAVKEHVSKTDIGFGETSIHKDYQYNLDKIAASSNKDSIKMDENQLFENMNIFKFLQVVSDKIFSDDPQPGQTLCSDSDKFEKEFRSIQKQMQSAYKAGDLNKLDELTEEILYL